MPTPVSTYRLQLHASFTFKDVENILPYLHQLGISTIYASPTFAASAGSMHGYDVSDPHAINPEIGTLQQLQTIAGQLQQYHMNWLQDVVPNHMVFSTANPRLTDVLERGHFSKYYNWFDVDWHHPDPDLHGRLMVPFLGKPLKDCLHSDEIKLAITPQGFVITYFDNQYPVSVKAYDTILAFLPDDPGSKAIAGLLNQLYTEAANNKTYGEWQQVKQTILDDFMANETNVALTKEVVSIFNSKKELLQQLLQQQYYVLCWWQQCNRQIDYRRFFAVNELISLNINDEAVFDEYHKVLYDLYQQNLIQGLRIDHIDGLSDPGAYIHRLRKLFGNDCYIIAEKILEEGENLPTTWSLQGTTGYEFCSQINWLLTNPTGAQQLTGFYKELLPDTKEYQEVVFEKKSRFLQTYMGGEWDNMVRHLYSLQMVPSSINRDALKQALGLFMCSLPVYRLYPTEQPLDDASQQIVQSTFKEALQRQPQLQNELHFLQSLWKITETGTGKNNPQLIFLQRLMQFTGPVMAKGVEDTTFYVYNALLAHNEVGDTPDITDYSIDTFHQWMQQRQQLYPYSLNATSTHDTKRGEDGRMRLLALTWLADTWQQHVQQWVQANDPHKTTIDDIQAPTLADEYFIYQSIIAGFPADGQVTGAYINRLKEYFTKSVREAKTNSDWQSPNTPYEEACSRFIQNILTNESHFINSFKPFFESILQVANVFSLTQVLVKITAPGVPDIYQGCELFNTSYVDPDNRRPVDYANAQKQLQELIAFENKERARLLTHLSANRNNGIEKLYITWKALQCRKKLSALFLQGDYLPLYPINNGRIIAYARRYQQQWVLVIASIAGNTVTTGISLPLPAGAPVTWKNEFTGELYETNNSLPLHEIVNAFPVALLTGETK